MLVIIRGAGDIATGIALRLKRAHIQVIMTDIPAPTAIRRTVALSQAIVLGETKVEDVTARRADTVTPGRPSPSSRAKDRATAPLSTTICRAMSSWRICPSRPSSRATIPSRGCNPRPPILSRRYCRSSRR